MIEDVVKLHMGVTAVAFACNYNRVATLQWGDGTDQTKYAVPANASLGWPFHHISHRVQSDSDTRDQSDGRAGPHRDRRRCAWKPWLRGSTSSRRAGYRTVAS